LKPSDINEILAAGERLHVEFKEARDRLPGFGFCKLIIQLGRFDELGSRVINVHRYLPRKPS